MALAEAIISFVSQIAEKEGLKEVREVKVKVGELQQVEIDILEFALSELKRGKFKNANFIIETVKASCNAGSVDKNGLLAETSLMRNHGSYTFRSETVHAYIKCPKVWQSRL